MKIKYLGPSGLVFVAPYGGHEKDGVKDYPDEFGADLLSTSRKQRFEAVDDGRISETPELKDMTVAALKEALNKLDIPYDSKATKAVLIGLIEANTAEPSPEDS